MLFARFMLNSGLYNDLMFKLVNGFLGNKEVDPVVSPSEAISKNFFTDSRDEFLTESSSHI